MSCEIWSGRVDLHLDGELPGGDAPRLTAHLEGCPSCAARALARSELKRAIAIAGRGSPAPAALRRRVQEGLTTTRRATSWRVWLPIAASVAAMSLFVVIGDASGDEVHLVADRLRAVALS